MGKTQTRRSISVSGALYNKLKTYCEESGKSMSGVIETIARAHLGMRPRTLGSRNNATLDLAPPRKIGRPQTKLKPRFTVKPEALEARKKELEEKRLAAMDPETREAHRRASNIFTF